MKIKLFGYLVLSLLLICGYQSATVSAATITTVAGTGYDRSPSAIGVLAIGDGGPAVNALLTNPWGVAVDSLGNLYIADSGNQRIRKVDTAGIITTIAGTSDAPLVDGGSATSTALAFPMGVAIDELSGNIYISDTSHFRIRTINPSGIISTIAGDGTMGFSGDGGAAVSAQLNFPAGIAVNSAGDVLFSDRANNRIRVVASGIIKTLVGTGSPLGSLGDDGPAISSSISSPIGIAVDSNSKSVYFADTYHNRVRKIDSSGMITTVAGNGTWGFSGDGGPATSASLYSPSGVAVDNGGNLYIADYNNYRIRVVDTAGRIKTLAGTGTGAATPPSGIGDGGPAEKAVLDRPSSVVFDKWRKCLYISEVSGNRVRKIVF